MNVHEYCAEFERRLQEAERKLPKSPNGYTYGWVDPRVVFAQMERDGCTLDPVPYNAVPSKSP